MQTGHNKDNLSFVFWVLLLFFAFWKALKKWKRAKKEFVVLLMTQASVHLRLRQVSFQKFNVHGCRGNPGWHRQSQRHWDPWCDCAPRVPAMMLLLTSGCADWLSIWFMHFTVGITESPTIPAFQLLFFDVVGMAGCSANGDMVDEIGRTWSHDRLEGWTVISKM